MMQLVELITQLAPNADLHTLIYTQRTIIPLLN